MFWHNFKYAGKMLIKGKDTLFWTILVSDRIIHIHVHGIRKYHGKG